jgi:hypothetical protein
MPAKFGGLPQIIRMTVPYQTVPGMTGDKVSGVGDINVFDIFLMGSKELQLGIGPMLVFDSA